MALIIIAVLVFFVLFFFNLLSRIFILSLFKRGNVQVAGLRGSGKDLLFSFVVNARKRPYISNVNYTPGSKKIKYYPLDFKALDVGGNTWKSMLSGDVIPYRFPYPDHTDIYVSDAGVYLPSYDCNVVQKTFPQFPLFMALSRHLGEANVHTNAQAINRPWDKVREQGDVYILCRKARVFFGRVVFLKMRVYDKIESCAAHVPPFPLGLSRETRLARANYIASHGRIQNVSICFLLPKKHYDTRAFKKILSLEE